MGGWVSNIMKILTNLHTIEIDKISQKRFLACVVAFDIGISKSITPQRFRKDLYSRCRRKFMLPEGLTCHSLLALNDRVGNARSQ